MDENGSENLLTVNFTNIEELNKGFDESKNMTTTKINLSFKLGSFIPVSLLSVETTNEEFK